MNMEKGISISTSFDTKMNTNVIRIEDQGTGIPPETLPHITDPFFTTRQGSEGVGLGLSISSTIVEEHGGTMRFISEVGRGTTAEIVFPADRNKIALRGEQND